MCDVPSDFGIIALEFAHDLEEQVRSELEEAFYRSNFIQRIKRKFGRGSYVSGYNVTIFRGVRKGVTLFVAKRIASMYRGDDAVSIRTNLLGEVVDVVDTGRDEYEVIFENGESTAIYSLRSLNKFCRAAGEYETIGRATFDRWVERYEQSLRLPRDERIADTIASVFAKWRAASGNLSALANAPEIESMAVLESIAILVIWYHVHASDDLTNGEVQHIVSWVFPKGADRQHLVNISRRIKQINATTSDYRIDAAGNNCYSVVRSETIPARTMEETEARYWSNLDDILKKAAMEGAWIEMSVPAK